MSDAPNNENSLKPLLAMQVLDSKIDQLLYRKSHLAASAAMIAVQSDAGALRPQLVEAEGVRDELERRRAAIEAEVESLQARVAGINDRLYGGTNVIPRDAQAMAKEVKQLAERQTKLEDEELELMEQIESATKQVDRLQSAAQKLAGRMQEAKAGESTETQEIDSELSILRVDRGLVEAGISVELRDRYETLRSQLGGVAVAAVIGNSCSGCHLTLSATELDRIRKAEAGEIVLCEECGRILVR
jgi:uncharacterized protein